MSSLDRQVNRARRRMMLNLFCQRLNGVLLVAATLWLIGIVVFRLFAAGVPLEYGAIVVAVLAVNLWPLPCWAGASAQSPGRRYLQHVKRRVTRGLLVGAVFLIEILILRNVAGLSLWHGAWVVPAAALVVGFVAALLVRPTPLQAAVALDSAAGLKERLSTALLVRRQDDPFARAAVQDAEKTAGRVHVPSHVRYRAPQLWPWSAAVMVAAALLAAFMPAVNLLAEEQPEGPLRVDRSIVEAEHKVIKTEFETKISKIKELAQDNPALEDLVKDIEPLEMPDQPTITPDDVRREAARRIDDVQKKLERELEAAEESGLKETKRMFQQLNQPGNRPANDKLSQSLASGDFEGARQAMQELANQIEEAAKNADNPESRQKLKDMQQQLQQLADQLAKKSDTVRLQKELENKAGLSEEQAKKLLEQLKNMDPKQLQKELQKQLGDCGMSKQQLQELAKKIQKQQKACQKCQKLSQALSKAAQACQKCQGAGSGSAGSSQAANALSDAASQLSDLEMAEQLMNELEAQISDFDNMRQDVCQGGMCPNPGRGRPGNIGLQGPNAGLGMGERIGKERVAYNRKPTKVKTRFQSGTVIGRMLIEGPQVRGQATAEEIAAAESEVRDALDNVEREDIPRQYHKALRTYFERLAGLMREQQGVAEKGEEADEQP